MMVDVTAMLMGAALLWAGVLTGQLDPMGALVRWLQDRRDARAFRRVFDPGAPLVALPGGGAQREVLRLFTPPEIGSKGRLRGTHTYRVQAPAELSRAGLVVAWVEQHSPSEEEIMEVLLALRSGRTFDVERTDEVAPS